MLALRSGVLVMALVCADLTWANGDLFFEAMEIPGKPEYVIFGNVKDERGKYLAGATVTVNVAEPMLSYTAETSVIGRYRTLDIGRAITGLGYEVDPSRIEVTVTHPGYSVARRAYRGKFGQKKGAVEMNFVMKEVRQ